MKESLCSEFNEIVVLGVTYQCKMSFTVHLIIWVTIVTAVTFKNLHNFLFYYFFSSYDECKRYYHCYLQTQVRAFYSDILSDKSVGYFLWKLFIFVGKKKKKFRRYSMYILITSYVIVQSYNSHQVVTVFSCTCSM